MEKKKLQSVSIAALIVSILPLAALAPSLLHFSLSEKKKLQSVSIAALIVSILPLAALAPSLLHFSLSAGIRTAWAGANIVFALLGLTLSVVCVRSKESRSIINIASTAISVFWALLMVGIVALALFLTFVQ